MALIIVLLRKKHAKYDISGVFIETKIYLQSGVFAKVITPLLSSHNQSALIPTFQDFALIVINQTKTVMK